MRSREIDCLVMSLFSFLSFVLIGISLYFDAIRPKGITQSTQSRVFSYLIAEFGYLISIWKFFRQTNLGNIVKLYYLQAFIANNIIMKYALGKKFIFFDLILLFTKIWHLMSISEPANMSEVCSHCQGYSIEMNVAKTLKMKIILKLNHGLFQMFSIMTVVYAWTRDLYNHLITIIVLFVFISIVEHHDQDEKVLPRLLTIFLHFISSYTNYKLIQNQCRLKE